MKKVLILASSFLLPAVAMAQDTSLSAFTQIATGIGNVVKLLIPIAFGLAILFFFWGLATYILGKEQDKELAKKRMLWGIIAIFIMASIWAIVSFLGASIGLGGNTQPTTSVTLPQVN